jgi:hypothetical protein
MIKVGDRFETTKSGFCTVIEYISWNNIRVRFEDGYEMSCRAGDLRRGNVKNPNHPIVCGVGFVGIGIYSKISHPRISNCWGNMLKRCYNENVQLKHTTYIGCTVDIRWYNFQNYVHDYLLMYGSDLGWQLDKDILFKHNKVYSPEKCCLVPSQINSVLIKKESCRGELLIGVTYIEGKLKPYMSQCSIKGKNKNLGYFKTQEEAYQAYKIAKETEIKRLADFYKDLLDPRVYIALMNYEVEIDD